MESATIHITWRPGYVSVGRQWKSALSPNSRVGWHDRAQVVAMDKWSTRLLWINEVNAGNVWKTPAQLVNLYVIFEFPDPGRRRDMDNLVPTLKGIIDGLVAGGCMVDDSTKHMTMSFCVSPQKHERHGVRIIVEKEA